MSNELSVIPTQLPAHLQAAPNMTEEFAGGTSAGLPIPSLSIEGKEFRLKKDGQQHNTRLREMEVIFVAARPGQKLSKRYYIKKYDGEGGAPDCSSADGITPDVPEPVSPSCATCPMNAWGSKVSDNGKESKACQDYKRVVVWPIGISVDSPVVLDLSATNVRFTKEQRKHTNDLDYAGYVAMVNKHGLSLNKVVTRIEFTDAQYPQLAFKFSRLLDEQEMNRVLAMRDSDDVNEVLKTDVHAVGGAEDTEAAKLGIAMAQRANAKAEEAKATAVQPTVQQPAEPTPAPQAAKPEPKPFTPVQMVDPEDGTELIAKSEAQLKKLVKAGYEVVGDEGTATETSVQVAPEPVQESGPEPSPEAGGDDASAALLAQLQGFLSGK